MFSFDEFEDMCEKLAEAWQQILMPFEKLSEVPEAIYNDPALWPKRNGVTPKKYGLSLQKKHLHKPFTPYQYIPRLEAKAATMAAATPPITPMSFKRFLDFSESLSATAAATSCI